jgi:capsular polysaccharide transport system permease protein
MTEAKDRLMDAMPFSRRMSIIERNLSGLWRSVAERAPLAFICIVALPTFVTAVYMFLIASPIYVSETHFVVRSRSQQGPSPFGVVLASVGFDLGAGATDAYEVDEYMMSRSAVATLAAHNQLRAVLDRPEADFLARFPRFFERDSFENLYKSYARFVTVGYDSTTGINTLRVQAFRPDDAHQVANALLEAGEKLVNALNRSAVNDIVEQSLRQVSEAQDRAARAEIALTNFRTREKLLDPTRASAAGSDIVAQLDAQVISLRAQRSSLAALAPESPDLPELDQKIRALEIQRGRESIRVAGESDSLAPKIGEYERLMLDRDYAAKSLANADTALEQAQIDARKKEVYLERVVEPDIADQAELPARIKIVTIVLVSSLIAYAIIMLVVAGLREHRQS